MDAFGELVGAVLPFDDLQIFQRLDMLLDKEGDPFRPGENQLLDVAVHVLGSKQGSRHRQAFPIGQPVQSQLVVIGFPAPGVHIFRPVGEDQQYSGGWNDFQNIFQCVFRAFVRPVQVLDRHHQGAHLRSLEADLFQDFGNPVLLPLRAHENIFNAAVFHRQELQDERER